MKKAEKGILYVYSKNVILFLTMICKKGRIQLLIPICLVNESIPDLALVVNKNKAGSQYLGHTCLTLDMAYNNARLIARPDSAWLKP